MSCQSEIRFQGLTKYKDPNHDDDGPCYCTFLASTSGVNVYQLSTCSLIISCLDVVSVISSVLQPKPPQKCVYWWGFQSNLVNLNYFVCIGTYTAWPRAINNRVLITGWRLLQPLSSSNFLSILNVQGPSARLIITINKWVQN